MKPFTYLSPAEPLEAARLLREHGPDARLIAGGQSLLLALKDRTARPPVLISLRGLRELTSISDDAGELVIGSTTTYATLSRARLAGWHSEIARMAGDLADRPVRTMGTVGGALCAADPRYDMLTLVVGVGASLTVLSVDGARTVDASQFFAPGGGTTLQPGDILTAIRFPAADAFTAVTFEKFRTRTFDAALASVLCALDVDSSGVLTGARITVGAAVPVPVLADRSSTTLLGTPAGEVDLDAVAGEVVSEVLGERGDAPGVRYARELVAALTRRALSRALATSTKNSRD